MVNISIHESVERQRILVKGIVQGVGFRPFVYGLAASLGLTGFVRNDSNGVTIEIEGDLARLRAFEQELKQRPPPLARIDTLILEHLPPRFDLDFTIVPSEPGAERRALISPDVATCEDCLTELSDPSDRRYHYPFINCTNCGPRFTIVEDIPYDRAKTTMRRFPMCPACQAEYEDPLNRRFHAQPNACPVCGPQVQYSVFRDQYSVIAQLNSEHRPPITEYRIPITGHWQQAAQSLAAGEILAVKGLGGYHLACDALNEAAVSRLRRRKRREAKPFALMVPDLATARQLCLVGEDEAELLQSRRRPIVLLQQRPDSPVASSVAPCYTTLGLMLPYTPLHVLLLEAFASAVGPERPAVLVMTSGNLSDEPIAYQDEEARQRLVTVADGWLTHDRDIHIRCDDSVARVVTGGPQLLRRARGYVPEPIHLERPFPRPLLACGGHLKNTFCLGKGRLAFVSHHIGDLENLETLTSFRQGIAHFQHLFDICPQAVAYDLHPDYLATKHALALDVADQVGVQHHHAHIASVMAEHGLNGPVIGLAADGTGYGLDGAVWGGEVLVTDLAQFERVAHLAYVPLPGGEQAIRQPWRMAAVYLQQAFGDNFLDLPIPFMEQLGLRGRRWRPLAQMIERGLNSPPTSSLGRLFDAVSALLGVRDEVDYEGQAAIELEMLATPVEEAYPFIISEERPAQLDLRPTLRAIVGDLQQGVATPLIAGRFHRTIAELLAATCKQVRQETGLNSVALSGGVFQNRLLLEQLLSLLALNSFDVFTNRLVPPNDGGLSLGQAAVASAQLREE